MDNLLLMKKGEIVYQGACDKADLFFSMGGFPCPEEMNPADHLLDCITTGTNDETEKYTGKLAVPINMDFGLEKDDFNLRAIKPWLWQFCVLFHRYLYQSIHKYLYINV
jgi:hypothetical protein